MTNILDEIGEYLTYLLIAPIQEPIFLRTTGKSFGPITKIAMITIKSNSNQPICGIEVKCCLNCFDRQSLYRSYLCYLTYLF